MGDGTAATCWIIFSILFVYLSLSTYSAQSAYQIYHSVGLVYQQNPYLDAMGTARYMDSISDPQTMADWIQNSFIPTTYMEQFPINATKWQNASMSWNNSLTPAAIGGFNRVLAVRFTSKMWSLDANTRGQFVNQQPLILGEGERGPIIDAEAQSLAETKKPFCSSYSPRCYVWSPVQSFNKAGGYTVLIDTNLGLQYAQDQFNELIVDGFFSPVLGAFTIDIMVYNGNVDQFVQMAWQFMFDKMGNCRTRTLSRSVKLSAFSTSSSPGLLLVGIRVICHVLLLGFFIVELQKIWELGPTQHFRQSGALLDLVLLLLPLATLISYWVLGSSPDFSTFDFASLASNATRADAYSQLEQASMTLENQQYLVAVNFAALSLRAILILSKLSIDLGIITKALHSAGPTLFVFFIMYCLLMAGSALCCYYNFGTKYERLSSPVACLYTMFKYVLMGDTSALKDLRAADNVMAWVFFYFFIIVFNLILKNVNITILLSGFDTVVFDIKQKNERSGVKEQEKFFLITIFNDLRTDIFGRCGSLWSGLWKLIKSVIQPLIDTIKETANSVKKRIKIPTIPQLSKSKGGPGISAVTRKDAHNSKTGTADVIVSILFMVAATLFIVLQGDATTSFQVSDVTLGNTALNAPSPVSDPQAPPIPTFANIEEWQDVQMWFGTLLRNLYSNAQCANSTGVYTNDTCDPTQGQQYVQQVANWNAGFLNTTFARVTVQPGCYMVNANSKTAGGFPIRRMSPNVDCASADCTSVFQTMQCRLADGTLLSDVISGGPITFNYTNLNGITSEWTGKQNFSAPKVALGPYGLHGGLVWSLGRTFTEAYDAYLRIVYQGWFGINSASMVIDWMTYNGNIDAFTHNVVMFSHLETGHMTKQGASATLPLNFGAGGGYATSTRRVIVVVLIVYVMLIAASAFVLIREFQEIRRQDGDEKSLGEGLVAFLSNPWRVLDTASLVAAVAGVLAFVMFITTPFRGSYLFSLDPVTKYMVPQAEAQLYNMPKKTDPGTYLQDDWYIFLQFEKLGTSYASFKLLSAINSFLGCIKLAKYASSRKAFEIFAMVLATGQGRNLHFLLIIAVGLLSYAFAHVVLFGCRVEEFSNGADAVVQQWRWLIGQTGITDHFYASKPVATLVTFITFEIIFNLISLNMFLATQLNTYTEEVGQLEKKRLRELRNASESTKELEYICLEHLKAELDIEIRPLGFLGKDLGVVKEVKPAPGKKPTQAQDRGISTGSVLMKVQVKESGPSAIYRKLGLDGCRDFFQLSKDTRSIKISIEDISKAGLFKSMFTWLIARGKTPEDHHHYDPPNTRLFIRHGAVNQVTRKILEGKDGTGGVVKADDQGEGRTDETGAPEDEGAAQAKLNARQAVKTQLENLLFSRWPKGLGDEDLATGDLKYEVMVQHSKFGREDTKKKVQKDEPIENGTINEDDIKNALKWDQEDVADRLDDMDPTGPEVWLDCVVQAIEDEVDSELLCDALRDGPMEVKLHKTDSVTLDNARKFFNKVDRVLRILEHKASERYFHFILKESEARQEQLQKQNAIIFNYARELEAEFSSVQKSIDAFSSKKKEILMKLEGLLDRSEKEEKQGERSHLAMLTMPWSDMSTALGTYRKP